ncbi:LacI family DNA-binding transcriptional regulator [Propionivibrio sp.]|uniref:LacI family DNA-binding transcriptional regulator n=1 Tax=Propionivibrio sp. TaxID=2212460 RepID=UPI00272E70B6|nr:LacI family DNA-binding transcriptional regulator [Propionivibrio sp.]
MQHPPSAAAPTAETASSPSRSVTLKDVARVAGLSPITVSRALNTPQLVRPATVARVREAVELTGYIPNLLAGGLASKRSRLVAAIVPQLFNAMFVETVQGLGDQLAAHGYQLLLSLSGYSPLHEGELVSAILSRKPDGIVLTGINHAAETRKRLLSANIPVVETWDLTPTPIDMLVGFSHQKIGETIARHLYGKGYRRFGLVWADDERAAVRRSGLEAILNEFGTSVIADYIVPTPATLALGRQGLQGLLESGTSFDVIVCSSDALAQGVMTEAQVRGIDVPGELAIMGFGDLDFAAHTVPPISSVHIDKRAIGIQAANALLARIEGRPLQKKIIDVGFELVERQTT